MIEDLDESFARIRREQLRILDEEVPQKVAQSFDELYPGGGWMLCPAIVERYADVVTSIQNLLGAAVEASNKDYEDARAKGFPPDFKAVRH